MLSLSWSSEHFSLRLTILFSTLGSAISVLLLWGFATHIVTILAFAATFGFCAGGFSGLWSRLIGLVIGNDQRLSGQMLTIFAASELVHYILCSVPSLIVRGTIARGVGTILSAPISSALLRVSGLSGAKRFGLAYASDGYVCVFPFTLICQATLTSSLRDLSFCSPHWPSLSVLLAPCGIISTTLTPRNRTIPQRRLKSKCPRRCRRNMRWSIFRVQARMSSFICLLPVVWVSDCSLWG